MKCIEYVPWLLVGLSGCVSDGAGPTLSEMREDLDGPIPNTLLEQHQSDVRQALVVAPAASESSFPDLGLMKSTVERVAKEVDEVLQQPEQVIRFRPFTSDERKALRSEALELDALTRRLAEGVSVETLESFVFARNPRIAEARKALQATVERYPQVVYVETILAQYVSFLAGLALDSGAPLHRDPVAMKFPSPGVLALKADLVSRDVDLARTRFERVVRDTLVETHEAFFETWFLERAEAIEREILGYLRRLEQTVSSRLETGRVDKSQVLQVQVEISSLEDDLITLEERRSTSLARLRELLDVDHATPIGSLETPKELPTLPGDVESIYATAREERQEIRLARDRVRRTETAIELAEKMTYPDWTLGLGYFRGIRPVDRPGGKGSWPGAFTTRPQGARTFWFGQAEAFLREMREKRHSQVEAFEAEKRRAEYLVRKELFALDEAQRKLALYRDVLLSQVRQAYEDTEAGYVADRVEFLNVIDALRRWLQFDLEKDRARRDYFTAFVRLEAATGTQLER